MGNIRSIWRTEFRIYINRCRLPSFQINSINNNITRTEKILEVLFFMRDIIPRIHVNNRHFITGPNYIENNTQSERSFEKFFECTRYDLYIPVL